MNLMRGGIDGVRPWSRAAVIAAAALVLALPLVSVVTDRIGERRVELARQHGFKASTQQARVLRAQWQLALDRARHLQDMLGQWLAIRRGAPDAARLAERFLLAEMESAVAVGFCGLAVIDTDTRLIWSYPANLQQAGEREGFIAVARRGAESAIGAPGGGGGPGDAEPTIDFARAIGNADGTPAAVALALFHPSATNAFLNALSLAEHDFFTVWRDGGVLLARHTPGDVRPPRSRFAGIFPADTADGSVTTLRFMSVVDGRAKLATAIKFPGGYIDVALDEERFVAPVLAATRDTSRVVLIALALLAACVVAGDGLLRQRRHTREAARRADRMQDDLALFREIHDRCGDAFLKLSADLTVEFASDNIVHLLGRPASDLIGKPAATFIDTVSRGHAGHTECRLLAADGTHRWVESHETIVDGTCYAVLRDVTDRHAAEQTAARLQRRLEQAALTGPGVVVSLLLDPITLTRQVTFMSPMVEAVTGYTVEEASAPGWLLGHCDPSHADRVQAAWPALAAMRPADQEVPFQHKSGRMIWLYLNWRPTRDVETGRIAVAGYMTDVTLRKQQEARAVQAAKMATVGQMAGSIAHELNQPLAIISLAAENAAAALDGESGIPSAMRRLARIREQAERAARLVREMRVFAGSDGARRGAVELTVLLDRVLRLAGHRLRTAETRLERGIPDGLPPMAGDSVLLEQVMVNLLINACEAYERAGTPAADRVISVAAHLGAWAETTGQVTVTVTDHAGGIDPAVIDRIFEPFFSTKPEITGVGLGLSFSHGALRSMGGTVNVSNLDGGAMFELSLPVWEQAQAA